MDKAFLKRIEALEAVAMSKAQYDEVIELLRCMREAAENHDPNDGAKVVPVRMPVDA